MKKQKMIKAVAALALLTASFTGCDNPPYDYDGPQREWWYDYGGKHWNRDDYQHGQQGSQDSKLLKIARTLTGEWAGSMTFTDLNDDGSSTTKEFTTDMKFFQYASSSNALSGEGIENDYVFDSDGNIADQQTLEFKWYISNYGDIYLQFDNDGTYMMDAGSSNFGYHLGYEDKYEVDTFFGHMIGIGTTVGKYAYIDLVRVNETTSNAKVHNGTVAADSSSVTADSSSVKASSFSFGKATTRISLPATEKAKFPIKR